MDFDGTLTNRDSFFPFIIYSVKLPKFLSKLPQIICFIALWLTGIISAQRAKEKILALFFLGMSRSELEELGKLFAAKLLSNSKPSSIYIYICKLTCIIK